MYVVLNSLAVQGWNLCELHWIQNHQDLWNFFGINVAAVNRFVVCEDILKPLQTINLGRYFAELRIAELAV